MQKRGLVFLALMLSMFSLLAQDSTKKENHIHDVFVTGYYNHLNDGFKYGMAIAGGYYKKLYVETRWNYEDLKTFSAFAGYSLGNNKHEFEWELIPMVGFSTGNTNAFIPALETNFEFKKFVLYSENEFAINLKNKGDDYFYSWSEFTYRVNNWLQPGIVAQRTRLYETGRAIDRGFMATSAFLPKTTISAYLFDPFEKNKIFFVFGLGINF